MPIYACEHCGEMERQLAEAKAELGELKMEIEAVNGAADYQTRIAAEAKAEVEAMRPFTSLILSGPDGETLVISSDIEPQTDGSFRFTVTSPISGRRFGVVCGITELRKQP